MMDLSERRNVTMSRATVIALVVMIMTAMGSSAFADGVSPWLPAPGAGFVNLSYVSQNANQFYFRATKRNSSQNG